MIRVECTPHIAYISRTDYDFPMYHQKIIKGRRNRYDDDACPKADWCLAMKRSGAGRSASPNLNSDFAHVRIHGSGVRLILNGTLIITSIAGNVVVLQFFCVDVSDIDVSVH